MESQPKSDESTIYYHLKDCKETKFNVQWDIGKMLRKDMTIKETHCTVSVEKLQLSQDNEVEVTG